VSGSTIGGFVGGVIGAWIGGPAGAQWGFMIGSAIGGYVDPEHIKGPSLGDVPLQTSQEGVPRPIVYGSPQPFAGNIIQIGPPIRVTKEEQQGKGGPVVESEEIYQTYAIRICEGPATVIQVWRDGKLVLDRTAQPADDAPQSDWERWARAFLIGADGAAFQSKTLFYTGDETQLPDPSLEALPAEYGGGVGNVPAYRGTAYMVVVNDNLTGTGGRIPQYQFRMASSATLTERCSEEGLLWWYPLDDTSPGGTARELVNGWDGTYANSVDPANGLQTCIRGPALSATSYGSTYFAGFGGYMIGPEFQVPSMKDLDAWTVSCWASPRLYQEANGGGTGAKVIAWGASGNFFDGTADWAMGLRYPSSPADERNLRPYGSTAQVGGVGTELSSEGYATFGRNYFIALTFQENPAYGPGRGDMKLYVNGALMDSASDVSNSNTICKYVLAGGGFEYASSYQFIGCVADIKGYNYALTQTEIIDKYLYSEDWIELPDSPGNYVNTVTGEIQRLCTSSATTGAVYLADIEQDIASRCGVASSQLDTSADEAVEVEGFLVVKQMPGADALRSLGTAYFRDYPEYDLKIVSTPRGLPTVVSLTDDDLVDSDEDLETRGQAIERPRKLNLYFSDPSADYAVVPVPAERTSVDIPATSVVGMELPLVMERNEAAQRADILLKCIWEEAQGTLNVELPGYQFAYLTAADCISYGGKRWRIDKLDQLDGTIKIEAKRDRIRNYTSNATANTIQAPTSPISSVRGPTILQALNLPRLTTLENKPGMYVGVTGVLDGWSGADIYISFDNGATETWQGTFTARATMGRLASDATASDEPLVIKTYDQRELVTITVAQLEARRNGFALTSDGVSEVGQFQTANENTDGNWDLTDVLRGQLGTTAASHSEGDSFLLLDSSVYFLPIDISYAGKTLIFRAVTRGTPRENASTVSVVFDPQFTSPSTFDFYTNASGEKYTTADGSYYYRE